MKPVTLVKEYLLPFIKQHHPKAQTVFLAGSFGRAMQNGQYQPVASSDADIVIVYDDLADTEFECSHLHFEEIPVYDDDIGIYKNILIDVSVFDAKSLEKHALRSAHHYRSAFTFNMIHEGLAIVNSSGNSSNYKKLARNMLQDGPASYTQSEARREINQLKQILQNITTSVAMEEKIIHGLDAVFNSGKFALSINRHWASGFFYINRALNSFMPEFKENYDAAFDELLNYGNSDPAKKLIQDLIEHGEIILPGLPKKIEYVEPDHTKYLEPEYAQKSYRQFLRFMTSHLAAPLDTSQLRGQDSYFDMISGNYNIAKQALSVIANNASINGASNIDALNASYSDFTQIYARAFINRNHSELRFMLDDILKDEGGLDIKELTLPFNEDLVLRMAGIIADKRIQQPKNPHHFPNLGL